MSKKIKNKGLQALLEARRKKSEEAEEVVAVASDDEDYDEIEDVVEADEIEDESEDIEEESDEQTVQVVEVAEAEAVTVTPDTAADEDDTPASVILEAAFLLDRNFAYRIIGHLMNAKLDWVYDSLRDFYVRSAPATFATYDNAYEATFNYIKTIGDGLFEAEPALARAITEWFVKNLGLVKPR